MALKCLIQFPIFAPPNPIHHRPATEVPFSWWNSVTSSDEFIRQDRTQKQIKDELRHLKRFDSADKTVNIHDNATSTTANETFKSMGTSSPPSRPSVTGNKSKYSNTPRNIHPAFRRMSKVVRVPTDAEMAETNVRVSEDGISYILPDAPFAYQYSYTETPKVKPKSLREPLMAPFGPSTMPRPWTGQKPLPPGKKRVGFDSFRLPPAGKKGVKPVQVPSQFLHGSGPKYVKSREEVLGEPLTKEEDEEMVIWCKKIKRQLNMGRDGLTHNMLDNIHALWKRKKVCKIKCKGVCTVDMDNVRRQLEEKTGGKIIYSSGGIIYLFRGRNYNYKTRPHIPLMLWKPVTPVYPRLIKKAPEGLTLEEASEMRNKGRKLIPICKLGKNGVYCNLVKNVSEAFEACELVGINCEGMNPSDYRKIGAKLKDLVPCVLISFEREHILMWRGRDWKSSFPQLVDDSEPENSEADGCESKTPSTVDGRGYDASGSSSESHGGKIIMHTTGFDNDEATAISLGDDIRLVTVNDAINLEKPLSVIPTTCNELQDSPEMLQNLDEPTSLPSPWTEGVLVLWKEAIECGRAAVLDHFSLDADIVYRRAVSLSQCAPPGPVFSHRCRKVAVQKLKEPKIEDLAVREVMVSEKEGSENKRSINLKEGIGKKRSINGRMKGIKEEYLNVIPQGSLRVDELAKLLS